MASKKVEDARQRFLNSLQAKSAPVQTPAASQYTFKGALSGYDNRPIAGSSSLSGAGSVAPTPGGISEDQARAASATARQSANEQPYRSTSTSTPAPTATQPEPKDWLQRLGEGITNTSKSAVKGVLNAEKAITDRLHLTGDNAVLTPQQRQDYVGAVKDTASQIKHTLDPLGKPLTKVAEVAVTAPQQATFAGIKSLQTGAPFLPTARDAILGKNEISGRELAENAGLRGAWATGAGLGADLLLDPTNLVGAGFLRKGVTKVGEDIAETAARRADDVLALPQGRETLGLPQGRPQAAQLPQGQEVLGLPEPGAYLPRGERGNPNRAVTPDVIVEPYTFALPEGRPSGSTARTVPRNQIVEDVLGKIKPIVVERMTPPLENPNELAKWVHSNIGDPNMSLNEVRQLSYEDLRQLAENIRSNLRVEDVARQVAGEHGYDLDRLLNRPEVTPGMITKARDAQRMRQVAGLDPLVRPNANRVEANAAAIQSAPARVGSKGSVRDAQIMSRVGRSEPKPNIVRAPEAQLEPASVPARAVTPEPTPEAPIQPPQTPPPTREEWKAQAAERANGPRTTVQKGTKVNQPGRVQVANVDANQARTIDAAVVRATDAGVIDSNASQYLRNALSRIQTGDSVTRDEADGIVKFMRTTGKDFIEAEPSVPAPKPTPAGSPSKLAQTMKGVKDIIDEAGNVVTGGRNAGFVRGASVGKQSAPASSTIGHIVTKRPKESLPLDVKKDQAIMATVDDLARAKTLDKDIEKIKGRKLDATESIGDTMQASRNAGNISKQILTEDFVDAKGNLVKGGESVKQVFKDIKPEDAKKFWDYLINKHAITRYGRNEKVFPDSFKWTPKEGKKIIEDYDKQFPEFAKAAAKVKDFNKMFAQEWLVKTGLIDQKTLDKWLTENPDYVDMKRYFSELEKVAGSNQRAKSGFGTGSAPVRSYNPNGSDRPILGVLDSMMNRIDSTVKVAKRNQPMQEFVKRLQEHPEELKGWAEIVPDPPKGLDIKSIDLSTPDGLDEIDRVFGDAYNKALKASSKSADNVVPVMVDGKPVYVRINDKLLLKTVLDMEPEQVKGVLALVTRGFKAINTGLNPLFVLTRSVFRDVPQAYINSAVKRPDVFVWDLAKAAFDTFGNKEAYKEFKRMGGGHNSPMLGAPDLLNKAKLEIMPDRSKLGTALGKVWHAYTEGLDRLESVHRVAEYKRLRGAGTDVERANAIKAAEEVLPNFKRRGSATRGLEAAFPYLNAAIQGLYNTAKAIGNRPGSFFMKGGLAVTTPALLAYYYNHDDPNYKDLPEEEKDRFIHIPTGGGTFFRLPLPPELAPLANVPRRILDQLYDHDKEAWEGFGKNLATTMLPPVLSGTVTGAMDDGGIAGAGVGILGDSIIGPIADAKANTRWNGTPIIPGYMENLSNRNQVTDQTSGLAKLLSRVTKDSPAKLDYIIRSYTGDVGNFFKDVGDAGVVDALGGIGKTFGRRLSVDAKETNKSLNTFYDIQKKYDTMKADIDAGDESVTGYNPGLDKYIDKTARNISKINKAIREFGKRTDVDEAKKEEITKQLKALRITMAKQATEVVKKAEDNIKKAAP